jgi:hypothetical protein
MITLIPRALLAICLLTGHLWYPHDGGPEVQQMSDQFPCFRCGAAIDRAFPVSDNPFGTVLWNSQQCPKCGTWNWPTGSEVRADLKFGSIQDLDRNVYADAKPASTQLATVCAAFTANMDRVLAAARMPTLFIFWEFYLNVLESTRSDRMTIDLVGPGRRHSMEPALTWQTDALSIDEWFSRLPNEGMLIALEGLLSSVIVGAWTAFEALATDLWVAALNANPKLGVRALGAEVKPNDDDSEKRRKAKIKQAFPIQRLHKHDYKIKNAMGSLLRDSKKWDFGRRDETCDAYKAAFGVKASDSSELDSIFDHLELQWLAALRNAFIHRGGIADESFLSLVEQHPTLKKSQLDKPIKLDGQLAKPLIEIAATCGAKLISFVDARLNV